MEQQSLDEEGRFQIYRSALQIPINDAVYCLRTGEPEQLIAHIGDGVGELAPALAVDTFHRRCSRMASTEQVSLWNVMNNPYNWQSHRRVGVPRDSGDQAADLIRNNGSTVVMGGCGMGKSVFLRQLKGRTRTRFQDRGPSQEEPPAGPHSRSLPRLARLLDIEPDPYSSRSLFDQYFAREGAPERFVLLFDEFDRYAEKVESRNRRAAATSTTSKRRGAPHPRFSISLPVRLVSVLLRDVLGSNLLARADFGPQYLACCPANLITIERNSQSKEPRRAMTVLKEITHHFTVGPPVQGQFFINRAEIIKQSERILSSNTGNMLISGPRRMGKTSLCLKLLDTTKNMEKTISTYMSMEADYGQSPARFTQGVLLHAIKSAADSLFSKNYSELLADLASTEKLNRDYGKLLELFRLTRQSSAKFQREHQKSVGASMVASAQASEKETAELSVLELSSFEYMYLLEELVELLRERSIFKFILFIDEANKLTLEANSRLIRENLSLFSSKGLQFCFVTTPEVVAAVPTSQELFHHRLDIGPFTSIDCVNQLIEANCRLVDQPVAALDIFSQEAIEIVWNISQGIPVKAQLLCRKSIDIAIDADRETVILADVISAINSPGLQS